MNRGQSESGLGGHASWDGGSESERVANPFRIDSTLNVSPQPVTATQIIDAEELSELQAMQTDAGWWRIRPHEPKYQLANNTVPVLELRWGLFFENNLSSLAEEPISIQILFWEHMARWGCFPHAEAAQIMGMTREELGNRLFWEPMVEECEPEGPWDSGKTVDKIWTDKIAGMQNYNGKISTRIGASPRSAAGGQDHYASVTAPSQDPTTHSGKKRLSQSAIKRKLEAQRNPPSNDCKPTPGMIWIYKETSVDISLDLLAKDEHELASWATPVSVDIRLLRSALEGDVQVTAMELLTVESTHYQWVRRSRVDGETVLSLSSSLERVRNAFPGRWVVSLRHESHNGKLRLIRRNMELTSVKLQLRDIDNTDLRYKFQRSIKESFEMVRNEKWMAAPDYTCEEWTPPWTKIWGQNKHLIDYYVKDLAAGVPRAHFPKGDDKGALTWAVEYVLDHPEHWGPVKLSQVLDLIHVKWFMLRQPFTGTPGAGWDVAAQQQHRESSQESIVSTK